jgi:uncharacterized protein (TIGR00251 family)
VPDDILEILEPRDDGSFVVRVHAQPGAGRSQVVGRHGDALKIRVAAPPEGGRANDAVAKLLADTLGAAAKDVELVGGASSRQKRFLVKGVELDDARRVLAPLVAGSAPGSANARRGVEDRHR